LRQRCRKNMKREKDKLELTLLVKSIEWKGAGSNPRSAHRPIAHCPSNYLSTTNLSSSDAKAVIRSIATHCPPYTIRVCSRQPAGYADEICDRFPHYTQSHLKQVQPLCYSTCEVSARENPLKNSASPRHNLRMSQI
jgi:hypothetical protein